MIANMEVKDRILLAATKLFGRNGIKSVSMDDIAQHLSVSKKTIYKWFKNKDEIVYSTLHSYLLVVEHDCEQATSGAVNAVDELFKVMERNKQLLAEIHPSIFYDLEKYHPTAWELWMKHKQEYFLGKTIENLRRGIAEGLYRSDLDVEVIARVRLSQIELSFDQDLFPLADFTVQRVQQVVLEHYVSGITTAKGREVLDGYRFSVDVA